MTEQVSSSPSLGKASRNERRKAVATPLNAVAVAILISAIIQPLSSGRVDLMRMILPTVGYDAGFSPISAALDRAADADATGKFCEALFAALADALAQCRAVWPNRRRCPMIAP